jgi:DNA-binding MarR family transcriptional regulator
MLTVKRVDIFRRALYRGFVLSDRQEVAIPALLRGSRGAYSRAIRARLAASGFEDLPRNGPFLLGGMANRGIGVRDLGHRLGVSKQAVSQLIDTLVVRGYLERRVDPDDRRRMTIELTERGRAAAEIVRDGVESVDDELVSMLSSEQLAGLVAGLEALCAIRDRVETADR